MREVHVMQNTEIFFGPGKLDTIGEIVAGLGKKALVVTTREPWVASVLEKIDTQLKQKNVTMTIFDGVVPNPTVASVNAGTAVGRDAGADVVIGLGGGSAIDSGKAIAVALGHGGEAWEYRLWGKPITTKTLPLVAVSTTSGTGSEVTPYSVVTNPEEHLKFALVSRNICPTVAIVDPILTLTVPEHITASTGFDAYAHAFESTLHKNANDYTDIQAFWAMAQIAEYLPRALENGKDLEARSQLALASTVAGLCITNVGCTLAHGIGVSISGHCPKITHGESLAVTYPRVAALTWRVAPKQHAIAARQLLPGMNGMDELAAAARSEEAFDSFLRKIGMRFGMADLGVPESMLDSICEGSFALPDYEGHPVVLDKDAMRSLLVGCYPSVKS
jgi:Alcohol dehydrogenase, class IV